MNQQESVTLCFSTTILSAGTTNQYGYSNNGFTDMRFDNINMKMY